MRCLEKTNLLFFRICNSEGLNISICNARMNIAAAVVRSPTAQAGWCRAVTRLLSPSKHRCSRFVYGRHGKIISIITLKSVHISSKFRVMDTFCDL